MSTNQPLFSHSSGSGRGDRRHGGRPGNRLTRTSSSGFSDLFSEFTRHISPAFNHERPERSVQMRLYTMHKVSSIKIGFLDIYPTDISAVLLK